MRILNGRHAAGRQGTDVANASGASGTYEDQERDALCLEVEKLKREQEATLNKLQSITSSFDDSEARVRKQEHEVEDLHRQVHQLRIRAQSAFDEETTWRELVENLEIQRAEEFDNAEQRRAASAAEIARLKKELERERQMARDNDVDTEHRRRLAADERCMRVQSVLDFITGQLPISVDALRGLASPDVADDGDDLVDMTDHLVDEILQQQKEAHRDELRELVAICNQELRRRFRSAGDLLDDEGLPQLVAMLCREGIAKTPRGRSPSAVLVHDASRADRLRQAVLGR